MTDHSRRLGPPQLTGEAHVAATADQLYDDLAMALVGAAHHAVSDREVFHLALSGDVAAEPGLERFYMRLVIDPRFRALPWERTHLWLVDEKRVPPGDEASHERLIREALSDHVPMRRRHKHAIDAMQADAAEVYERELREVIGAVRDAPPRLDFVVLAMGVDGHTAGLFPGSPAVREARKLVVAADAGAGQGEPRVTMTLPMLNAARQVAVLVTGEAKAETIARVESAAARRPDAIELPILGVDPEAATLWYLDAAAAAAAGG
jgi:6-phosphogluconolactonase